jgi:hypothetical protein
VHPRRHPHILHEFHAEPALSVGGPLSSGLVSFAWVQMSAAKLMRASNAAMACPGFPAQTIGRPV